MKKNLVFLFLFSCFSIALSGCYSFTGASIPAQMSTVNVAYFDNQATLVYPNLSQSLTEAFKTRIRNQTSLSIVRNGVQADGYFEGRITNYTVNAISIQSNNTSGGNRLSITVAVSYRCVTDPKLSFEQSFTRYQDFSTSAQTFDQQQADLVSKVNDQLVEDIFNRAFANW